MKSYTRTKFTLRFPNRQTASLRTSPKCSMCREKATHRFVLFFQKNQSRLSLLPVTFTLDHLLPTDFVPAKLPHWYHHQTSVFPVLAIARSVMIRPIDQAADQTPPVCRWAAVCWHTALLNGQSFRGEVKHLGACWLWRG